MSEKSFFTANTYNISRFLLKRVPLTILLTFLLYQLGRYLPYSGDGHYTEELVLKDWVVLMHSVLTTLVHKIVFVALEPFGWNGWDAVSVSSSIAGAMAVQVLYSMRRDPAFLLLNIVAGSFLVFVGEVENYAWVNLCLLASFRDIERFLQGKTPFGASAAWFFLACLFHLMALFYLPAFFWVMYRRKTFKPWEFALPFFLFVLAFIGCNLLFQREGLDLDMDRLVPLFFIQRKGQFFTLFSQPHLEILAYFHQQAAFLWFLYPYIVNCLPVFTVFPLLGIPLEWLAVFFLRKRIDSPFKIFLLHCSWIGLVWTTFWHPDLGRLDWDLFSQMGFPLHLLLGLLAADRLPHKNSTETLWIDR